MEMQAIYKTGETHLQTTALNGICQFTDGKTVDEYLAKLGPDFVCIPFDDAMEQITEAQNKTFVDKEWDEITEDQWIYWLEVLPPQKWKAVDGVELFRVSEYLTSNITRHCARYNDRFFTANRRTSENYQDMAKQIIAL